MKYSTFVFLGATKSKLLDSMQLEFVEKEKVCDFKYKIHTDRVHGGILSFP